MQGAVLRQCFYKEIGPGFPCYEGLMKINWLVKYEKYIMKRRISL